ncbi:MAG TPA: hypothetical protein VFT22_03525, partial [Kofleriaceae bacterium]|nr:hypothetical protein [Kofleriaceae bacterium]
MRRLLDRGLVIVAVLGAGGLASALLAQGGAAAPSGQHRAGAQASAANRSALTKRLVGYLKKRGFQVNPGYPLL